LSPKRGRCPPRRRASVSAVAQAGGRGWSHPIAGTRSGPGPNTGRDATVAVQTRGQAAPPDPPPPAPVLRLTQQNQPRFFSPSLPCCFQAQEPGTRRDRHCPGATASSTITKPVVPALLLAAAVAVPGPGLGASPRSHHPSSGYKPAGCCRPSLGSPRFQGRPPKGRRGRGGVPEQHPQPALVHGDAGFLPKSISRERSFPAIASAFID